MAGLHLAPVAATVGELLSAGVAGLDVAVLDLRLKDGSDPVWNVTRLRR